nr:leucine-rich repeat protein [Tanacetum cinerariifolium]
MLSYLDLSYNNLSGNITSSLGEYISLTQLYLSGNIFQGIIPFSFSSLGGLGVPDISDNNLSGKIPQFLDTWKSFEFLNISFNDYEGEVPVVGVFANASAFSVLGNDKLCGGLVTLELPKCKEKGTICYAPPEYGIGSEMTSSGDIYSFGILLLEVMTGKKPTDNMFNEEDRKACEAKFCQFGNVAPPKRPLEETTIEAIRYAFAPCIVVGQTESHSDANG